jgi:hypothetical protein
MAANATLSGVAFFSCRGIENGWPPAGDPHIHYNEKTLLVLSLQDLQKQ